MKKVRFLLLSFLTMLLFTFAVACGSESSDNSCEENADCKKSETCYAGYCGEAEPSASFFLKFNLQDADVAQVTCDDANIKDVNLTVSTHDFEVMNTTVKCELLNTVDITDASKNGFLVEKLWAEEDYDVKVEFVIASAENITKSLTVKPAETAVNYPTEAAKQNITVSKVAKSVMTAKWLISDGFGGTVDTCGDIQSFRVAFGEAEACDEAGANCDFSKHLEIPCTDEWMTTFIFRQAEVGVSLNIYATKRTDAGVVVLFQYVEKDLKASPTQFSDGEFERTFTLNALTK